MNIKKDLKSRQQILEETYKTDIKILKETFLGDLGDLGLIIK